MTSPYATPEARKAAQKLLAELLPKASVAAHKMVREGRVAGFDNAVVVQLAPLAKVSNLAGCFVLPVEGGVAADIMFRKAPKGIPNMMGTDPARPMAREEAEAHLLHLVTACVLIERGDLVPHELKGFRAPEGRELGFVLGGTQLAFEDLGPKAPELVPAAEVATAKRELDRILAQDFAGGVSEAVYAALSPKKQRLIVSCIRVLLHAGVEAHAGG